MNRQESMTNTKHKNIKDRQKKHHLDSPFNGSSFVYDYTLKNKTLIEISELIFKTAKILSFEVNGHLESS